RKKISIPGGEHEETFGPSEKSMELDQSKPCNERRTFIMFGHCPALMTSLTLHYFLKGIVSDCCDIRGYSFDSFEEDTIESMAVAVGTRVEDVLSIFVRYQMAVAVGARVEDVLSIFVRYQMAVAVGTRVEDVLSIFVGYQMAVAVGSGKDRLEPHMFNLHGLVPMAHFHQ
ncbi:hypothetical protein STEG23_016490, partial [Scotinomys teguina]